MWTLLLPFAFAAEPPAHPPTARVVADTLEVGGRSAPLVLGPCTEANCELYVEGPAGAKAVVSTFGPGPFRVVDLDHGWLVSGHTPGDAFSFAWEPLSGLAPEPTVLIHTEHGGEHVIDSWRIVTLGDVPRVVWSAGGMPRFVGPSEVRSFVSGGATLVVRSEVVGRSGPDMPHDDARIAVYRHVVGEPELVEVSEATVPLYATVFASFPTRDEADAAVAGAPCLKHAWFLDSGVYPKLTPGLTVLAKVTPDRALADRWLEAAKRCRADAYVKRAR